MKSAAQILTELTPIFRDALDDKQLVLSPDMSARSIEGWDSFTHTQLILAIEEHYRIHFRLKEVMNFKNVGDMCSAILRLAP
ncbi:MAG TPA: acyl carrier protein [Steroidobacteraceae bacterium]|jgi:acyl carrier protein